MYEAIKRTRGVAGFMCDIIGGRHDIKAYADNIMYVYENFGSEIIALGTDFFGLIDTRFPKGLEDVTKIRNLFEILLKKGMKEADIEKLAYKNALRVVLEHAKNGKTTACKTSKMRARGDSNPGPPALFQKLNDRRPVLYPC